MNAPHHDEKFFEEHGKCFYCDKKGGVPFLMTADDELYCSRCFEDFSDSEFAVWLEGGSAVICTQRGRHLVSGSNAVAA